MEKPPLPQWVKTMALSEGIGSSKSVEAAAAVRRLRDTLAALSDEIEASGVKVPVSASIGFETTNGADLDSVETLRRHAEIALRQAKRDGGNRGVYYRLLK